MTSATSAPADTTVVLDGTVRMQPGQSHLWMVGRRVQIVRRTDPRPGAPAVWCTDLTDPAGRGLGVLVDDVTWDQPDAVNAWLAAHPPPHRR
jgi:hypothetical protein